MAAYKEQYYSLEESQMQDLIVKAKSGSSKHQEELLEVFNNFLTKYVSLLYYGRYNIADYDVRRFISLFVKDPYVRFVLIKNKINKKNFQQISEVMRRYSVHGKKVRKRRGYKTNSKHDFLSVH
jgi:hypothetical protein